MTSSSPLKNPEAAAASDLKKVDEAALLELLETIEQKHGFIPR